MRAAIDDKLSKDNIRIWYALVLCGGACVAPDVVFIARLFEGTSKWVFDQRTLIVSTLCDLITLLCPEQYLHLSPAYKLQYLKNMRYFTRTYAWLAI